MRTFSTKIREESRFRVPCALCGAQTFKSLFDCDGFSYVICRACSLVQQNPQPDPLAVVARYDASYLPYQIENEKDFLDLEIKALEDAGFFKFETNLPAPREFLDVGCSTGALLKSMEGRGWKVRGVEVCGETAEYGIAKRGLDIHVHTLEYANFPDSSFECVHASHLIEHLNDPASFLHECRRILTDDGRLFLTTPNISGFQARITGSRWRSCIFDHLYLFSASSLANLLQATGYVVEKVSTWGGWARGQRPEFLKPILDRAVKRLGMGDVMAIRARKRS